MTSITTSAMSSTTSTTTTTTTTWTSTTWTWTTTITKVRIKKQISFCPTLLDSRHFLHKPGYILRRWGYILEQRKRCSSWCSSTARRVSSHLSGSAFHRCSGLPQSHSQSGLLLLSSCWKGPTTKVGKLSLAFSQNAIAKS
jgi:hypothetical protein